MKNKPIHLLFDVGPITNARKSGVGYYAEGLLDSLATTHPDDLRITGYYFNFLGRKNIQLPTYSNVDYKCVRFFPSKVLNILRRFGIELPLELFVDTRADIILFPNFVGHPVIRKTPTVPVIHDLGYIDYPEHVSGPNRNHLLRYVPRSIKRSRFLIAVSETTKQAMIRQYHLNESEIFVTPIPAPKNDAKPIQPKSVTGKFILFIGTLEPRKNFISLVHAYALLPDKVRKEYGLVLAGGTGWYVDKELQEIRDLQARGENIVTTGYFSDGEKAWLLKNASLFVHPSHYEGFGMPILEAMEAGAPTAVSDIDIFHEVSGQASLYFDQNNPADIARVMEQILGSAKLRETLRDDGYRQAASLDWATIARQLYERISAELQ